MVVGGGGDRVSALCKTGEEDEGGMSMHCIQTAYSHAPISQKQKTYRVQQQDAVALHKPPPPHPAAAAGGGLLLWL